MFIAQFEKTLIEATNAKKGLYYFCPSCKQRVILKSGEIKLKHFAHLSNSECKTFSENESKDHLLQKINIANFLKMNHEVKLEAVIPKINQRADVFVDKNIAIEFQLSPISIPRLKDRNNGYKRKNIRVIWILGKTYFSKLNINTINKFLDENNQVYLWDYQKDSVSILFNFSENKFSVAKTTLECLISKPSKQNEFPRETNFTSKQLLNLQDQIIKGHFPKKISQEVYQFFGKSVILAPMFVHFGSEYELSTSNFIFRLKLLVELEKNSTITLPKLVENLDDLFAKKSNNDNLYKKEIVSRAINELNIKRNNDLLVIKEHLRWFNNLQEKISELEDKNEFKQTNNKRRN